MVGMLVNVVVNQMLVGLYIHKSIASRWLLQHFQLLLELRTKSL